MNLKTLYVKNKEIIMYLIFGVLTTLVDYVSYAILLQIGVSYITSNAIAITISILFAYVTNKLWVFESQAKELKANFIEFNKFIGTRLFSMAVSMFGLILLVEICRVDEYIAKALLAVLVVVLNYVLSKLYTFKKTH